LSQRVPKHSAYNLNMQQILSGGANRYPVELLYSKIHTQKKKKKKKGGFEKLVSSQSINFYPHFLIGLI